MTGVTWVFLPLNWLYLRICLAFHGMCGQKPVDLPPGMPFTLFMRLPSRYTLLLPPPPMRIHTFYTMPHTGLLFHLTSHITMHYAHTPICPSSMQSTLHHSYINTQLALSQPFIHDLHLPLDIGECLPGSTLGWQVGGGDTRCPPYIHIYCSTYESA